MALFHTTVLDEQIKALPTVDTASGSIATFDTDMTENLVEVKCQIVAQQSGSGTPSPSNPRPIQTYTEMKVTHCGKNLVSTANITDVVYNDLGQIRKGFIIRGGGTYTISVQRAYTNSTYVFVKTLNADGTFGSVQYVIQGTATADKTLTIENGGALLVYSSETADLFETIVNYCSLQIELNSEATTYEPFGTTANIPFGQTVAQGLLNVGTGKLRVTHKKITLNGTTEVFTNVWGASTNGYAAYRTVSDYARGEAICDKMVYSSESRNNMPLYGFGGSSGANTTMTFILPDTVTSLSQANTWLQNNNLDIVYELATPIEIQLDSVQITALLNENNIWCDTGDTSVKYILSVGKAIS